MKIIEQDQKHMVLGLSTGDKINMTIGIVIGISIIFLIQIYAQPLLARIIGTIIFTSFLIVIFLFSLGENKRIVIDKPTKTVTISYRSFLLARRQHNIPYSDVRSVVIQYESIQETDMQSGGDSWSVDLDFGNKFHIDHGNKRDMFWLAYKISSFIGVELKDKSAKPDD